MEKVYASTQQAACTQKGIYERMIMQLLQFALDSS